MNRKGSKKRREKEEEVEEKKKNAPKIIRAKAKNVT